MYLVYFLNVYNCLYKYLLKLREFANGDKQNKNAFVFENPK